MKNIFLISSLLFLTTSLFGQDVDFGKFMFNGLSFNPSKKEILYTYGKPIKIYDPNYDCGFLSSEEQETEITTFDYIKFKYTGNDEEGYLIEEIKFETDKSLVLYYGDFPLSNKTTTEELESIFKTSLKKNDVVVIFNEKTDDSVRIHVKNGHLSKFEYWSPC